MIRNRSTEDIPDDVGWCCMCRCYVETGHYCGDGLVTSEAVEVATLYDAARDGPF